MTETNKQAPFIYSITSVQKVLIVLFVGVIILVKVSEWTSGNQANPQVKKQQVNAKEMKKLRYWKPIPFKPIPVEGRKPKTPSVERFNHIYRSSGNDPRAALQIAWQKLKYLIETCPHDTVSKDLPEAIQENKIKIKIEGKIKGNAAKFQPNIHIDEETRVAEKRYPVTLVVSLQQVARISTPAEIREFWLMLIHEMTHYHQYLNWDVEKHLCCLGMWEKELHAHSRECKVEREWGGVKYFRKFCSAYGHERAFKQRVFGAFRKLENLEKRRDDFLYCLAKYAGHPHPKAFLTPNSIREPY